MASAEPARPITLAITDVTVIDVAEGAARPGMTVVVVGDRIRAVGLSSGVDVPAGARVVDGTGRYLIPGLWDMHVHSSSDRITREAILPMYVANGVTGVRDMKADCFDPCEGLVSSVDQVQQWREEIAAGVLIGPRIVAGSTLINGADPGEPSSVQAPATEAHARALARLLADRGVDFVKIYSMLRREPFFALADEARTLGIPIAGHVPLAVRASEASDAGLRSVEHLQGVLEECSGREDELRQRFLAEVLEGAPAPGDNLLRMLESFDEEKCAALYSRLAANRTWQVPTLLVAWGSERAEGWRDDPRLRYVPPEERQFWAELEESDAALFSGGFASARSLARKFHEVVASMQRAGVRILAGSDAGTAGAFWGFGLHDELELLVEAGLTEGEALRSATIGPAEFLEATDSLGTVEPGNLADLVLLDANPLEDISSTRSIHAVILNGRWFDRAALDTLLADVAQSVRRGGPAAPDTLRYVEVVNGHTLGGWSAWRESPDTWGYASDRQIQFPRTDRLTLDSAGLPVRLDATGQIGEGIPWFERFERDGATARWSTPRERREVAAREPVFYAAVHPAYDVGVLARALLRQPSRALDLLPSGRARLEGLGERLLRHDGRSRTVRLFAVHGLDLFPLYVWLDDDGTTFADEWTIREGWAGAFPELKAAMDAALADHRRALARDLVPAERTRPLVIRGARLFDAGTRTIREDVAIVVEGDRIVAVTDGPGVEVPAGAEIIEADGRMVLPGLWDMHAHHVVPADQEPLWTRGFAPLHLAGGVTTARDMGGHVESTVELRDAIENGEAVGARILMAGYMNGPAGSGLMGIRVENAAEARAAVDRFAERGFIQIKTYNQLPADLVHVVIERAKERGLRVSGHVPWAMTAGESVEAGYDELHHAQMTLSAVPLPADEVIARGETWDTWYQVLAELTPDSAPIRELIQRLADSGVALDATLGHFIMDESPPEFMAQAVDRFPAPVSRRLNHTVFSDFYVPTSPMARPAWERAVENTFGLVRAAHEAGVPIVVGTDTWAGFGLHHEMELLVRAGIPAAEVLTLATIGAARIMGMDDQLGSIEPGKLADLILVDGDPTVNIHDIRRVMTVVKDGRVYDPAAIYRALGVEPCCEPTS